MKKVILAGLFIAAALPAIGQDFRARYTARRDVDRVVQVPPSQGSLQAAAASGNVLQAVNPAAPLRYGSGQQFVAYEQSDPFVQDRKGRPIAIRLFALAW